MKFYSKALTVSVLGAVLASVPQVDAAVSAQQAAHLKTDLTPLGAEKAGNSDGTIPAWTGGYTTPIPGFKNGGKRPDPFANEKPILTINAQNMDKYADKLTEGLKAMLKKYPDTFKIVVYPTHRTAAAPQWVYDNTFKNATSAKSANHGLQDAYGGIPFPIPQNGEQVMWNHRLHWRGTAWHMDIHGIQTTSDGQHIPLNDASGDFQMPYYFKGGDYNTFVNKDDGVPWEIRMMTYGPAIRAGEGIVGRNNIDPDKQKVWVYFTGQRRVRRLPNACCDTPTPSSGGISMFDETDVFGGRTDRFDWKIIGKKEMYIPYNANSLMQGSSKDVLMKHFINPDKMRFELHRVWVVEATVAKGKRHLASKRRYYVDEDTWTAVLADHWDHNNKLWQLGFAAPAVMPDIPATSPTQAFGFYDLLSGSWYYSGLLNDSKEQYKIVPQYSADTFTPDALAGEGIR